jgi:hypothetical protein
MVCAGILFLLYSVDYYESATNCAIIITTIITITTKTKKETT